MLQAFLKDERGATAVEYGLVASIMFLACFTAFTAFGDSMGEMYDYLTSEIVTAIE